MLGNKAVIAARWR